MKENKKNMNLKKAIKCARRWLDENICDFDSTEVAVFETVLKAAKNAKKTEKQMKKLEKKLAECEKALEEAKAENRVMLQMRQGVTPDSFDSESSAE